MPHDNNYTLLHFKTFSLLQLATSDASLPCPVTPVDLVFLLFTVALSVIDQLPTDQTAQLVLYVHFDCYHPVDICIKYIEYKVYQLTSATTLQCCMSTVTQ